MSERIIGTITRVYDGLDRLTSETTPQATVGYGYDDAGRRTRLSVPGLSDVTYTYDDADRLTGLARALQTVSFGYDDADRQTRMTLPNGIEATTGYDAASRPASITYARGATTVGDLAYGYDAAGRRTSVGGSFARTGLPAAVASATYDAASRLITWGGTTIRWDAAGNLIDDGANTYTWNARGQLANQGGITGTSFVYDAFGRRQKKSALGATIEYVYDGLGVAQERQGLGASANLLGGLGVDEVFTRTDASGARHFLTDVLGSTIGLADDAGAVATGYIYEPFGKTTATGAPNSNPYQFTGRENDGGLYYYRARYYHPTFGRFISEDPLGFGGGDPNLYAYVGNNPLNHIDPMGLEWWDPSDWARAAWRGLRTAGRKISRKVNFNVSLLVYNFGWTREGGWYSGGGIGIPGVSVSVRVAGEIPGDSAAGYQVGYWGSIGVVDDNYKERGRECCEDLTLYLGVTYRLSLGAFANCKGMWKWSC